MELTGVKWRGVGCVIGSFLIQMTVGSFVGTIGNMVPYLTSYMRWAGAPVTIGDLALVQAVGGMAQGVMFMVGGLLVIPYLGLKGCLYLSSVLYVSGWFLTYWSLGSSLPLVIITYGVISASAMNLALVPTFLLPTAWFPHHKGKIIGLIQAGFGLAPTIFVPLQTFLINPANIPATLDNKTDLLNVTDKVKYFTDVDVLERIPLAFLYLAAIYGGVLVVGLLLVGEPPSDVEPVTQSGQGFSGVKEAVQFLVTKTFTRLDFYLLFLTRLFCLVVVAGLLGHWKSLSLTVTQNDRLVSVIGSVNGILNCLSRLMAGLLIDRFTFRQVMPVGSFLLACVVSSLVFFAKSSFTGFVICLWASYALAGMHFSTVPTQALTLFGSEHSNVVIGTIGLSDTFSYLTIGVLNQIFLTSSVDHKSFLWFFLCLAGFAGAAIVVSALVTVHPGKEGVNKELQVTVHPGREGVNKELALQDTERTSQDKDRVDQQHR